MTVHIVPVGLSLAEYLQLPRVRTELGVGRDVHLKWKNPRLGLSPNVRLDALLSRAFGSGSHEVSDGDFDKSMNLIDRAHIERWPGIPGMSAEVDAMRAHDVELTDDDLVLLLASDTPEGLANAAWNALILAGGDRKRVWYRNSLAHAKPESGDRRQIVIMRAPHLDVTWHDEFPKALQSLTELAKLIQGNGIPDEEKLVNGQEEKLTFHVTGGYRATVPYLIGVAEWLRSLRSGTVSARLLPGKGNRTFPMPLRSLEKSMVCAELSVFEQGRCPTSALDNPTLLGYAFDQFGGEYRLNDFGKNMRTLFVTAE